MTPGEKAPASPSGTVLVVDDDDAIAAALNSLLRSVGLEVRTFGSISSLLSHDFADEPSCLVLDVRLPNESGLDVPSELQRRGIYLPIVFITGFGDIPMTVQAMRAGAVDFLPKPFEDKAVLAAVWRGLDKDRARRGVDDTMVRILGLYGSLRPRERQIMQLVTAGLMNKQIAGQLGLSEVTVKFHRGNMMRKMAASSLADLVRMAGILQTHSPDEQPVKAQYFPISSQTV